MRPKTRVWRAWAAVAAMFAVAATAAAAPAAEQGQGLGPDIEAIMHKPGYEHARWGVLEIDASSGQVVHRKGDATRFVTTGSTAKLFSVSGAWHTLGPDHHFTTPVHAVGDRSGSALNGNLVMIAQGDLTMGGRTKPDGTVDFTKIDHTYANDLPGATETPEDPLAGINELARQVRRSGITEVNGNVIVDDRVFTPPALDPQPTPLMINDNLIDLLSTPTTPGRPAQLSWRPQVAPYHVTSTVQTVAAGGPTDIQVSASPDGTQIKLSGTVAADSQPALRISGIQNPSAFGRTAFIEALARAGVTVTATPTGSNPVDELTPDPAGSPRVAAFVSPRYEQYARLTLKESLNLGGNLTLCLMAAATHSHDCNDGFSVMRSFLTQAGVDVNQVQLDDGRGVVDDKATPVAESQILRYWLGTRDADTFRHDLPILGVDGSLGSSCTSCPAKGKVFAKTGTIIAADSLKDRLAVGDQSNAGYLEAGNGRLHVFYVGVDNASATDIQDYLRIADDVAQVGALLQEQAEAQAQ